METAWEDEEEEKPARRHYLWKAIWQAVFWIYVVSWIPMLWWSDSLEPIYGAWWHGPFVIALCLVWIGAGYRLYPRAFPTWETRSRVGALVDYLVHAIFALGLIALLLGAVYVAIDWLLGLL